MQNFSPKKIAIFRALQLGDMLCSIPAIRALRRRYPTAVIYLIGLPWAKDFVKRFSHYIDKFIEFPGFEEIPEKAFYEKDLKHFFASHSFDLVIQMHGNGRVSNKFIEGINAGYRIGYALTEDASSTHNYLPYPTQKHEIEKWISLLSEFGIVSQGDYIDFPIFPQEEMEYEVLKEKFQIHRSVVIHVGARDIKRQWKKEYFAMVADLLSQLGYNIIFTGTQEDTQHIKRIQNLMISFSLDLSGYTSLGCLAYLLKNAELLITNDTGISHLASALRVKSIIIFSAHSDPLQWAPLESDRHISVYPENAHPSFVYNLASLMLNHIDKLLYIPNQKGYML